MKKVLDKDDLFILQNHRQGRIINTPWPHLIIDNVFPKYISDTILERFPEDILKRTQYPSVYTFMDEERSSNMHPWFKELNDVNIKRLQDINSILTTKFKLKEKPNIKFGGIRYAAFTKDKEKPTLQRNWHVDNPEKCWQILVYFFNEPICEGGEIFLGDAAPPKNINSVRKYTPVNNRAIIWQNTDNTFHKYYSSTNTIRRTLNYFTHYVKK